MRNIFKRQNDTAVKMEIFKDWNEMEKEDLRKEIKAQKTEDLKELLVAIGKGLLLGFTTVVIGMIVNELVTRD